MTDVGNSSSDNSGHFSANKGTVGCSAMILIDGFVFAGFGVVEMGVKEGKEVVLVGGSEPILAGGYFLMASGGMEVKRLSTSSRLLMNIMIIKRGL